MSETEGPIGRSKSDDYDEATWASEHPESAAGGGGPQNPEDGQIDPDDPGLNPPEGSAAVVDPGEVPD